MAVTRVDSDTLEQKGKRICLDFINTVDWRGVEGSDDFLPNYGSLVTWSRKNEVLSEEEAEFLRDESKRHPTEASTVFNRAIAVRDAMYRIFSAFSHGNSPDTPDMETFNNELAVAMSRSQIVSTDEGFTWYLSSEERELDRMLWPIIHDAADLLTSRTLNRVGECANEGCGWLYIDMSRNRSRQWCSMKDCGNKVKARRFYARKRAGGTDPE